jgi:hypothetical protein
MRRMIISCARWQRKIELSQARLIRRTRMFFFLPNSCKIHARRA